MTKIMKVTVSPKGETKLETIGFSGSACQDATRDFERALGVATGEQFTGEYYTNSNEQQVEAQN
jgi:hypothetical protein